MFAPYDVPLGIMRSSLGTPAVPCHKHGTLGTGLGAGPESSKLAGLGRSDVLVNWLCGRGNEAILQEEAVRRSAVG